MPHSVSGPVGSSWRPFAVVRQAAFDDTNMNWEQARRLLRLPRPTAREESVGLNGLAEADAPSALRAHSICVASGKGGTGKSLVSASLAALFAREGRTLLLDADLGVGNAHILQDATPDHTIVDVVEGGLDLAKVIHSCRPDLDLLAGGSGFARMAGLSPYELHMIGTGLERLEVDYKSIVVDSAAGISNQTVAFAASSDVVLIVTTPDLTAMTDAYAFLKVLLRRRPACEPLFVVNRVTDEHDANSAAQRIADVSRKFLEREPRFVGALPEDRAAFRSIQRRAPLVLSEPESDLAHALHELADVILAEFAQASPRGLGRRLVKRLDSTSRRA